MRELKYDVISRQDSKKSCDLVVDRMRSLTNADVGTLHLPVEESDRKRGVGDWAIVYFPSKRSYFEVSGILSACHDAAVTSLFVDKVREVDPDFVLIKDCWRFRKENFLSVKYNI